MQSLLLPLLKIMSKGSNSFMKSIFFFQQETSFSISLCLCLHLEHLNVLLAEV